MIKQEQIWAFLAVNKCGRIGCLLSTAGLVALCFARSTMIRYLMICSLPGLVLSLVGLFRAPRGLALLGLLLGIIGSMYLPTVFLPWFTRG
jgi:hypothetical protein